MEDLNDLKFPSMPESEPSSPQPSAVPDLEWCLRREHDVALIYARKDDEDAFKIMEEMTDGTGLDVRLQTDESFGPNMVDKPKNIASKCWLVLVVHTHNTTDDTITRFIKDELIGHIRLEQSEDYIRPLYTEPELSALRGLKAIDPLPWVSQCNRTRTKKRIKEIIEYQKEEDRKHKVEKLKHKAPVKHCDETFKHQISGDHVTFGAELGLVFSFLNLEKDLVYKMDGRPKGLMVIINNYVFEDPQKYPDRDGSCRDAESLQTLFLDFGFEVKTENNLTSEDIMEKLAEHVNAFEKSDYCCFAAAILSHGKNGGVLGTDGNFVSFKEIKDIFFGDHLIHHTDKPKLFFIQACQKGATSTEVPTITSGPFPLEAHFYWAFATVPGYPAMRDEEEGSYFIKCLVDVFANYAREYDLGQLMDKVAHDVGKIRSGIDASPQVPERRSTLYKQLYFFPGI